MRVRRRGGGAARVGLAGLVAALVAVLLGASVVRGHASLERADPPPGAVLETAPRELRLWFSEAIEPRFSSVQVLDRARRPLPVGALRVANAEGTAIVVALPELSVGTYTVAWRVLSRVDGHVTQGLYPLTIGLEQVAAGADLAAPVSAALGPLDVLTRWLNYIAAALLLGAMAFGRLVLAPALAGRAEAELAAAVGPRLRQLALLGAGGLALGAVLLLWVQAQQAGGVEGLAALHPALWLDVLGTRFGPIWLLRLASIAALAVLAVRLYPRQGRARPALWLLVGPAGALLLLTTTLGSHAVAAAQGWPAAWLADWVHLVAASVWGGGLAALAATLPLARRAGLAVALLRRFSALALLSVAALLLTGLYQTWLHVRTPSALLETAYGQALAVKLALLVPALVLGAQNLLAARRPAARLPVGRVRRAVWGELVVLTAVLGVVGVLTSLPPAWDVYRLAKRALVEHAAVADLRLTLRVDPGAAGVNTFDLEVREQDGQPARQVQRVALRFRPLLVDLGESELRLAPAGEAHFRGQGGYLSLPGYWQIEIIVRRAGQEDARTAVRLGVPSEPGGALPASGAAGAPGFGRTVLLGLLVLALGVVLVAGAARLGRRRLWAGVAAMLLGFVLSAVGTYAATTAWLGSGAALVNPFPPDEASVRRGGEIYAQHCATCHGPNGRGDGPLAATISPPPVDLRLHVTAHSEAELFQFVSRGLAGTPMPSFAERLSADDRWHVVNYIRTAFDPQRRP